MYFGAIARRLVKGENQFGFGHVAIPGNVAIAG